jgi:hypothetical protein
MTKRKIYYPPPLKVLYEYAEKVCRRLAENGDKSYLEPEIVNGLTRYLEIAFRIEADYRNRMLKEEDRESDHKVDDQEQ